MPFHSNTGTDAPCVTCKTSIPACIPLGTCCTGCTHLDI